MMVWPRKQEKLANTGSLFLPFSVLAPERVCGALLSLCIICIVM